MRTGSALAPTKGGAEVRSAAVELVRRSTQAQGVPLRVEDESTLKRLADLFGFGVNHVERAA